MFPFIHFTEDRDSLKQRLSGECVLNEGFLLNQGVYREVRSICPEGEIKDLNHHVVPQHVGYIVLGFKSIDRNFSQVMVDSWKDWTGARYIYMYLPDELGLARISFYTREAPDSLNMFMYVVVVECRDISTRERQCQTLWPLLNDVGAGKIFGTRDIVDVFLYDRREENEELETMAENLSTASLPCIRDITITRTLKDAVKDADYVILNPRLSKPNLLPKDAAQEQADFFATMAIAVDRLAKLTVKVVIVAPRNISLFCHIFAIYTKQIPWNQVTGLTYHIEMEAINIIARRLKVAPTQINGIAIFGERTVDMNMARVNLEYEVKQTTSESQIRLINDEAHKLVSFKRGVQHLRDKEMIRLARLDKIHNPAKNDHSKCTYCKEEARKNSTPQEQTDEDQGIADAVRQPSGTGDSQKSGSIKSMKESKTTVLTPLESKLNKFLSGCHCHEVRLSKDDSANIPIDGNVQISYLAGRCKEVKKAKQQSENIENPCYRCLQHPEDEGEVEMNSCMAELKRLTAPTTQADLKIGKDGHTYNYKPLEEAIDDSKWVNRYFPQMCEHIRTSPGFSLALALAQHLKRLHQGTSCPFSVMTCCLGAFGMPDNIFLSGPAVVTEGKLDIQFCDMYEMSDKTRLKLIKEAMELKLTYLAYDDNVWSSLEALKGERSREAMIQKETGKSGSADSSITSKNAANRGGKERLTK